MVSVALLKKKLNEVLNDEHHSLIGRGFNLLMAGLIICNVLALITETVPPYRVLYARFFSAFEVFSVLIFTVEYLLRLWVSADKKKFALAPMSLIDLFSILPFYLPYVHVDFRFLRSVRLLRLLRILKLARYSRALQTLLAVVMNKRHELIIAASFGGLMLILTSSAIYFLENPVQPDKFTSIPDAMWWSVVTLTTVGYGDIYPITLPGRILGGLTAFFGIGMFALPAGILASGFSEMIHKQDKIQSPEILINIDVSDLQKATAFYEDCFRLSVGRKLGEGCVEMIGFKYPIYLLEKAEGTAVSAASSDKRTFARHWTPLHLDFVVPNIESALRRARQAGATVEGEIKTAVWGKIALLADPFGNGFCLIEFIGQGYDEIGAV
jgi:voltage-gated potassium channel